MELDLNSNMGCFFIGVMIATPLFGLTCAQVMYYMREYPGDMLGMKILVYGLWTFDTLITVVSVQFMYKYLVQGHMDPLALTKLEPTGPLEYMFAAIVVLTVQLYYLRTIWILLGRKFYKLPVVGTLVVLAFVSFGFGIANCAIGFVDPTLPGVYQRTRVPASVQPVTASVTDVCITVCLCWALHNENTGLNRTDTLVRKLMVYAINRGILTSVIQVGQAVAYLAANTTLFYWSMFHFPASKVYVNSVMAILNARHHMQDRKKSSVRMPSAVGRNSRSIPLQNLRGDNVSRYEQGRQPTVINISTSQSIALG